MKKILSIVLALAVISGCKSTHFEVAELDPNTGFFPSKKMGYLATFKKVDLDSMKELILVPNGDFSKGQMENIGYFEKVITFDDLEKLVIENGLTDEVPSIQDRIGVNKAAKAYKNFLWLRFDDKKVGGKVYAQAILTNPITLEDIFIAERAYNGGMLDDQNVWYPLFNSLVEYIRRNSKTYN